MLDSESRQYQYQDIIKHRLLTDDSDAAAAADGCGCTSDSLGWMDACMNACTMLASISHSSTNEIQSPARRLHLIVVAYCASYHITSSNMIW